MTGDESYHAHCFTCRTCKRRIEELVFAKTSQGIYCMASLVGTSIRMIHLTHAVLPQRASGKVSTACRGKAAASGAKGAGAGGQG